MLLDLAEQVVHQMAQKDSITLKINDYAHDYDHDYVHDYYYDRDYDHYIYASLYVNLNASDYVDVYERICLELLINQFPIFDFFYQL